MTDSPPHRWYLHPLWTSLAVVFVVGAAIVATIGGYAWRRAAAIAWIEQSGGTVDFELPTWTTDEWEEYWPRWLLSVDSVSLSAGTNLQVERLRALREARTLDLSGIAVTDADLAVLGQFYRLESLYIDSPTVTDAGLPSLAKCTQLSELMLAETSIGDEGLKHLTGLPIEGLDLSNTRVTDAGLETLARYSRLNMLGLDATAISDAGLERLKGLPLVSLSLDGTKVTDAGLAAMGPMSGLQSLELNQTSIGDAGLAVLGTWPRLSELSLARTPITDAGLAHLAKLPLTSLDIAGTSITDAGLEHLPRSPGWTWLELSGTRVTPDAAGRFAEPLNLRVSVEASAGRLTILDASTATGFGISGMGMMGGFSVSAPPGPLATSPAP